MFNKKKRQFFILFFLRELEQEKGRERMPLPTTLDIWDLIFSYNLNGERRNFLLSGFRGLIASKFAHVTKKCSKEQAMCVYNICFSPKHCLIEGSQGTGKSFIIALAKTILQWFGVKTQICAFTGIAAVNCGGSTLHHNFPFFKLEKIWNFEQRRPRNRSFYIERPPYAVLFIDEISMVDPVLAEMIQFCVSRCNVRVVCLGDFKQLPPVSTLSKRKYFFQSSFMSECQYFQLTKSFRQQDGAFISIINSIGSNDYSEESIWEFFRQRHGCFKALSLSDREAITHLYYDNKRVNEWNMHCFNKIQSPVFHVALRIQRIFEIREKSSRFDDFVNLPQESKIEIVKFLNSHRIEDVNIKVGMRFMFTRNIRDFKMAADLASLIAGNHFDIMDIANGMQGQILGFDGNGITVNVNNKVFYFPFMFYKVQYKAEKLADETIFREIEVAYYPLTLSYAITFHKSQGLTLDRACIALKHLRDPASAYVAVSRVRTMEGVYLIDFGMPKNDMNSVLVDFYKNPQKYKGVKRKRE